MHRGPTAGITVLVLFVCSTAVASTFLVDAAGGGDATTLAGGMALAATGDTVLVAPGVYDGPDNRDINFAGREIRLVSTGGAAVTVIDCGSAGRAFVLSSGEGAGAVIQGFTVRGGHDDLRGGAVLCDGSSPRIEDCVFEECTAWDGGSEGQGGAVYCTFAPATIVDCVFRGNTAREGACVYLADSPALVSRCRFVRNTALRGGGGVRILRIGATVEDCTFFGNEAPVYGGGIYCCYSAPTVERCTFSENAASEGGAIYGYDASPSVTDCILAFSTEGSAVHCPGASAFEISYCCIFGNAGGDEVCGTAYENVFLDPAFCDTTAGTFELQDCSPCVGGGSGGGDIGAWPVGCACDDTTGVATDQIGADGPGGPDRGGLRLSVSPNPTGAGASIAWSGGSAPAGGTSEPTGLAVFTTAGRLVRDLTMTMIGANGPVLWNGRDDSGRPVAAGVYVIRLETETRSHTAKVVVIR